MFLELISKNAANGSSKPPILFVHGAYVGAWCWEERFLDWFASRGYDAHAVSLRGHGGSDGRGELDSFGLADYAQDIAHAIERLPVPPVLIGHSMGALVVQKYLESGDAPALVLACPVPSFGLLPSSFSLAVTRPALFANLNAVANGGRASREALGEAFFGGAPDPQMLERCYQRTQRESRRALFDMTGWGLPSPWRVKRPPTLVLGAEKDALIPASQARGTAGVLGADYRELPSLGHALMLDEGWEAAAQSIAGWLEAKGF